MKKLVEQDFRDRFKHMDKSQLNKELLTLCNELIRTNPNTWKKKLTDNKKHKALVQLIKEI